MPPMEEIEALKADMVSWRRHLHTIPETAFEEKATSAYVGMLLELFGLEVDRGLAGTGLVATLKGDRTGPTIGLRADMDALDIEERTNREYRSRRRGKMHACGHDGHMSMLLGAAKHLAAIPDFPGTVYFIVQPAEENEGGGRRMIEEGLFRRFPMSAVYGLHNWPGQPVGTFAVKPGPLMAAYDIFELTFHGHGGHGAMPNETIDPIVIAGEVIGALQTIASRTVHPVDSAVVSVTQVHGGDA